MTKIKFPRDSEANYVLGDARRTRVFRLMWLDPFNYTGEDIAARFAISESSVMKIAHEQLKLGRRHKLRPDAGFEAASRYDHKKNVEQGWAIKRDLWWRKTHAQPPIRRVAGHSDRLVLYGLNDEARALIDGRRRR